ncbi:His Kinase A (phospho-acceptor) domain-containing protein [Sulfitobacter marinus]|uniref:histidine kinase n=1 Tax=Sulfitobacter marinus TaxID=394264 RepID=A0A1I6VRL4_9RHOB|nr:CHASE domain-containing protein [Sulfitobacter marinus]SFT16362.1 His Kinase A (phospho-acceptor) domain-containing protein [Sulfitobacter marinus]
MNTSEPHVGGVSVLHITIVLMSLAMTIGAYLYSRHQVDLQVENRFHAAKDRTIGLIVDRMSRYEDALWSGVAHVDALGGQTTRFDWKAFAQSLKIRERYPGANSFGVITYVKRGDFARFQAARAAEGPDFAVYPEHDQDFMLPITYIEPEDINAAVVGLDVAHETNRRAGVMAIRDSGAARITGPIFLVQDSGKTPGFLFYAPFYRGGKPQTLEARQDRFAGVVYASFVVRKLVEGLLSKDLRNVRFSIQDNDKIIYDEHSVEDASQDDTPMFSETVTLDMYGRNWVLDIRTNKTFRQENGSEQPMLILIGGLIIEILIFSLLVMLARSNRRAQNYAGELTVDLRAKTKHLEQANAEIEQFVYIASHDLRTPIRGIGYLADVIEEDLEEIFGPLDDRAEIKAQFKMIHERVNRMNDLTKGIMEFSRIGNYEAETPPSMNLKRLIADCVVDLGVEKPQIRLSSEVDQITCDSHNFRRVFEGLITNAFKYHPDPSTAQIDVKIEDQGDRLKISVKDNGNGISPEFHGRIFDVFQTLRKGEEPESTGIGLAIVKKAVQRHGYNIGVASSEKEGAEFTFFWPSGALSQDPALSEVA